MMKGAFEIEVVRNGRKLKLDFSNRILKSGLDFQYNYSVTNNTDSIIKDLFVGGTHSVITDNTTAMDVTPLATVPYTNYITPDFSDETAELFTNTLVFRFEPQETMVIRQLGTGHKSIVDIGGVPTDKYDYFSLANLRSVDGELAELTVYQGDIITINYTVTFFNYIDYGGYNFNNSNVIWNMVRANPNWQLCGFDRKLEVAAVALNEYWGQDFEPFVVSNTVGVASPGQTYYQYRKYLNIRNITLGYKVGALTAADLTDAKYKTYISMAGVLPYWETNNSLYYKTVNSVNYIEAYTGTMARLTTSETRVFDPNYLFPISKPTISDFKQEIDWQTYQSNIKLSAKITPFSVVMLTYNGKVYALNHNGDTKAIMGYADKTGYWYALLPIQDMIAAAVAQDRFGGEMFLTVINDAGMVKSDVRILTGSRYGLNLKLVGKYKANGGPNATFNFQVQSLYTGPDSSKATPIYIKIVKINDKDTVLWETSKFHSYGNFYEESGYFNSAFAIRPKTTDLLDHGYTADDLFDGTFMIHMESNGLFYEFPIGTTNHLDDRTLVLAGAYTSTPVNVASSHQGLSDTFLVDLKLTKLT